MAEEMTQTGKQTEALYTIAKMNGYNGPKSSTPLKAFFNSSDALKAKARAVGVALNRGGMVQQKGYAEGGTIDNQNRMLDEFGNPILRSDEGRRYDADGFFGDPRRMRQDLVFDPKTGTYRSFDSNMGGNMLTTAGPGQNPNELLTLATNTSPTAPTPIGTPTDTTGLAFTQQLGQQTQDLIGQTMQPYQADVAMIQPETGQMVDPTAGQAGVMAPQAPASVVPVVSTAVAPTPTQAATVTPTTVAGAVQAQTAATQAAQGQVSQQAQAQAAQQATTSVSGMEAAQGTAIMMNSPVQREIQQGELISGEADAEKAAQFTEQIEAAQATPTKQATVAGQLDKLMADFEGGETPAWAAGSMRTAMQTLAARGLGASSLAGQAVVQAAMEAALPIAQADASIMAQFESQNLTNRQQRAMLAAQQRATFMGMEFDQAFQARVANSARIGDIANMNFTAEQQVALENARAANTVNLNNLSNRQAMVMAEAAALSQLDMANLNNRQQTAVQNAQNFLQMDMANLSNAQQTAIFKAQQNIQALFTDQAAQNAAAQFNATSENQTDQFFANLGSQVSQFNATQNNAMAQFNVNSINALREFNADLQQQRDLFNAQNGLVVAQANAQWRQNLATINTAAANESNMLAAKTLNAFTATNLDAYWQRERDIMSFAFTSAENAADRMSATLLQQMSAESQASLADEMGKGSLTATLLKGGLNYLASKAVGSAFNFFK